MKEIGTEYPVIAIRVIPAMTGGGTLFMIGMSSFMTFSTTEAQRTVRFGVFSMFLTILGIIASPMSGVLFRVLTYVEFFSIVIVFYVSGLLYVIFFIKEVKAADSPAMKTQNKFPSKDDQKHKDVPEEKTDNNNEVVDGKCHTVTDFFDPSLIVDSLKVVKRQRVGKERKILWLAIICQSVFFATHGEEGLYILFARTALRWTTEFGMFVMYMTGMGLIGTAITTGLFVNILKVQDATLGIISILGSLISKPVVAFSKTTPQIFVAVGIDMFGHSRYIAIKSLISKIVDTDELGKHLFYLHNFCQYLLRFLLFFRSYLLNSRCYG